LSASSKSWQPRGRATTIGAHGHQHQRPPGSARPTVFHQGVDEAVALPRTASGRGVQFWPRSLPGLVLQFERVEGLAGGVDARTRPIENGLRRSSLFGMVLGGLLESSSTPAPCCRLPGGQGRRRGIEGVVVESRTRVHMASASADREAGRPARLRLQRFDPSWRGLVLMLSALASSQRCAGCRQAGSETSSLAVLARRCRLASHRPSTLLSVSAHGWPGQWQTRNGAFAHAAPCSRRAANRRDADLSRMSSRGPRVTTGTITGWRWSEARRRMRRKPASAKGRGPDRAEISR